MRSSPPPWRASTRLPRIGFDGSPPAPRRRRSLSPPPPRIVRPLPRPAPPPRSRPPFRRPPPPPPLPKNPRPPPPPPPERSSRRSPPRDPERPRLPGPPASRPLRPPRPSRLRPPPTGPPRRRTRVPRPSTRRCSAREWPRPLGAARSPAIPGPARLLDLEADRSPRTPPAADLDRRLALDPCLGAARATDPGPILRARRP